MPDIRELGRLVKAKYPDYARLSDEEVGRLAKAKFPNDYSQFTDTPAPQAQGVFESFQTGVAGPLLRNVVNTAVDAYNRPLETLERVGRGALEFASAFDPAGAAYEPTVQSQAARVAELQGRAEAQRPEAVRLMELGMRQEEAKPRTRAGRIAFGTGRVLGEAAFPTSPETVVQNIVTVPFGGAAAQSGKAALKAGVSAIRRTLGRGAEQIIEAEARSAPGVLTGAVEDMARIRAASAPSAGLNAAIAEAAAQVPESMTRRVLGEISSFPRAMMSSLDISAPGRQGLILAASPSRWGAAIKAGGRMFQAFKPEAYERITKEIANHADAAVADDSGLYLAFKQGEELFSSRLAAKVPGVTASQRAYETYLDSLRMSTFSQYKGIIDAQGLTAAQAETAYKAAAKWINVATGRGSFGKRFDDAIPFLSNFLFAPRYTASRFNVLNPKMYRDNFMNPATRVVAKQQMKDLVSYLGLVATTYGIARIAGADVNLSPSSPDFLKIRAGNKTYDPGAGLTQVMRFAIRVGDDLFHAAKGDKADWGKDAGSLTLKFLRSKLAPVPSYAVDFFSRRTYEGKDFDKFKGAYERVLPLMWSDFGEALYNEGIGSAAATLPGAIGVGVQSYARPGGFIETALPLLQEFTKFKKQMPELRRVQNESDDDFNTRTRVFSEALQQYGVQLVGSDEYRNATEEQKRKALDYLGRRISNSLMRQGERYLLSPAQIMYDAREGEQSQRERQAQPRALYDARGSRIK